MQEIITLATENLLSPVILCFILGLAAALGRSDLSIPEAAAKMLSIYLLFAIGFKGGVSVAGHGLDATLGATLLTGVALSALLPFLAFGLLRVLTSLDRMNAAAVAGHYGSISIVTFLAGANLLAQRGIDADQFLVLDRIRNELQEIKKLIQARPAAPPPPSGPNVKGKVFDLGANPTKGERTAKLTLVEFTDYQ